MEKFITPELLADNADRKENFNYFKQYSEDEIITFKDELAEVSLVINDIELEKKRVMADFTLQMKEPKENLKQLLTNIRQNGEFKDEECFVLINPEYSEVGIYSPEGHLVHSRPCRPIEMQKSIIQMNRTGS